MPEKIGIDGRGGPLSLDGRNPDAGEEHGYSSDEPIYLMSVSFRVWTNFPASRR